MLDRTWAAVWDWYKFVGYGGGGHIVVGWNRQAMFIPGSVALVVVGYALWKHEGESAGAAVWTKIARFGWISIAVCTLLWVGLLASPLVAFDATTRQTEPNESGKQLATMVSRLSNGEISRIDILEIPPRILTRTRITPAMLEEQYSYRLTISDVRDGPYWDGLLAAAKSVSTRRLSQMKDVRWAAIFYDVDGNRAGALYFDKTGTGGAVNSTPVSFEGNFFEWLNSSFAGCFR